MQLRSLFNNAGKTFSELFRVLVDKAGVHTGWEGDDVVPINEVVEIVRDMYEASAPAGIEDARMFILQPLADNASRLLEDGGFVELLEMEKEFMLELVHLMALWRLGS
jgi:hypothetical protein